MTTGSRVRCIFRNGERERLHGWSGIVEALKKKPGGIKPPTYPADIEQLCADLESGASAWQLAISWDTTTPLIYHWYKQWRGMTLSEYRAKNNA